MKRLLLWIGGIVGGIALLGVLAILFFVFVFDWNAARGPLGARVEKATGRSFGIAGDIGIDWGRVTVVTLHQVTLGNAPWSKDKAMVAIDEARIGIDLLELLRLRIVLPEVALRRPVVHLEKPADGRPNWDLSLSPATDAATPDSRSEMPEIGHLVIRDGEISFRDEVRRLELSSRIATVEATGGGEGDGLHLEGKGTLEGKPFTVEANGGALMALREERTPWPIQLKLAIGETRLAANGTLAEPVKMEGVDLVLALSGPDARELYPLLGIPAPATPPYKLAGTLVREGQVWRWRDFSGKVGGSDLAGNLAVDLGGERPRVTADLVSERLVASDLGLIVGVPTGAAAAGDNRSEDQRRLAEAYARSDRVLPDAPLDLERVRKIDAHVKFAGRRVTIGTTAIGSVAADFTLDKGVLRFAPLALDVAGGRIASRIEIDARSEPVRTDADVRLTRFRLADMAARAGYPDAAAGTLDGRVRLTARGDSLRRALADADGQATFLMGEGRFSRLAVELIGLDIARSLGLVLSGDRPVGVRCLVADWVIEDGDMTSRALTLATEVSDIAARSHIDLGTEKIDGAIEAHPKKASVLSARSPIEFGGTLRNPAISPDVAAIAGKGAAAAALGIVLTPLASILAFLDLGSDEAADCGALMKDAGRHDTAPAAGQPSVEGSGGRAAEGR